MEINKQKAKLNDIATNSEKLQNVQPEKGTLSEVWVAAIFQRFQARYFAKWTSPIDGIEEIAVKEWAETLGGLTGDEIKRGLEEWDDEWPPSSVEFKRACKGKKINDFGLDYTPEYYLEKRPEHLLESDQHKEKNKQAAKEGVEKMRDIISKNYEN